MSLITIICPLCRTDYQRTRKQVNVVEKRSGRWTCKTCATNARNQASARPLGSKRTSAKGYVFEKTTDGWIQEHRAVMQRFLCRPLKDSEVVHHKNHNKQDNRLENLEVMDAVDHTVHHHVGAKRPPSTVAKLRHMAANRHTTRLTAATVVEARRRVAAGEPLSVAKDFGVSPMTINRAVRGKTWRTYE